MPDSPTDKPTKKRQRVSLDDCLWPILIEACGGVCVKCTRPIEITGPLQRGHIQRHADAGPVTLENIQPLCKKCNGEDVQRFAMDEYRPDGWQGRFIKLLGQYLRQKLVVRGCHHPEEGVTTPTNDDSIQNTRVIAWDDVDFEECLLLPTAPPTHPTRPLHETRSLVAEAFRLGVNHPTPLSRPFANTKSAIEIWAAKPHISREDFLGTVTIFLNDESLLDGHGQRPRLAWQLFVDNFVDYLEDWKEAEARRAAERERLLKRRQEDEARVKADALANQDFNTKKQRVADYLNLCCQMERLADTGLDQRWFQEQIDKARTAEDLQRIKERLDQSYRELHDEINPHAPSADALFEQPSEPSVEPSDAPKDVASTEEGECPVA